MKKLAISIDALEHYAKKLPGPRNMRGYSHRFHVSSPVQPYDYYRDDSYDPIEVSMIEFHCEPIRIRGVEALAWFYHDLLVKVVL